MSRAVRPRGARTISRTIARAPAKINLTLEVVERLRNGYHAIRSVMVRLPRLADTIDIRIDEAGDGIRIRTGSNAIPVDERNLCHVAASQYLKHVSRTAAVEVIIGKVIPVAAGLGGGSSDAAVVLRALNRHFGDAVASKELSAIGAAIGKDLAFFLEGAPACMVAGMGERVRPLPVELSTRLLLVNPGIEVSTRDAYAGLSQGLSFMSSRARADRSRAMVRALRVGDMTHIAAALYNDFEVVVERRHPVIKEVKQLMLAFGARGTLMSGSGSTVFGLFASASARDRARLALAVHHPSFVVACA